VYDTSATQDFQGQENSNGDGTVEVYAPSNGSYLVEYRVDNGATTVGTAIHDGTLTPTGKATLGVGAQGVAVAFDTAIPKALGNITLPAGGELTGIVTVGGTPTGNVVVQVRLGNGTNNTFRITSTRTQRDGSYSISAAAADAGANAPQYRVCGTPSGGATTCWVSNTRDLTLP